MHASLEREFEHVKIFFYRKRVCFPANSERDIVIEWCLKCLFVFVRERPCFVVVENNALHLHRC